MNDAYIKPIWPAPDNVIAYSTTRLRGHSKGSFASFNLGGHVEDEITAVAKNRTQLINDLCLPNKPLWLNQIHKSTVINAQSWHAYISADGCFSSQPEQICVVMTADCLPILLCDKAGSQVMALHGGWRSLHAGIIKKGLLHFTAKPENILAWLGPAISKVHFEVGPEVKTQFISQYPYTEVCFSPINQSHYLMDIYLLANLQLQQLGVTNIYGAKHCTYSEEKLFYSYRRNHKTGRMASLIYFNQ